MSVKPLLLILFLVLLSNAVFAVPPFQATTDAGQLIITVPKPEFVQQSLAFNFHIHVYNHTGHLISNSSADCYIHVYNNVGTHLIDSEMSFDTNNYDFYYELNSTTTADKGLLPFITWCNTTIAGGFYSGDLEINDVTSIGITDDNTQGISLLMFILFGTILFFAIPKLYGSFVENEMVNLMITRFCYVIGFYLMVLNSAVVGEFAVNAGYATEPVWRYMWLLGTAGWILLISTVLKTLIVDIPKLYQKTVQQKRGLL